MFAVTGGPKRKEGCRGALGSPAGQKDQASPDHQSCGYAQACVRQPLFDRATQVGCSLMLATQRKGQGRPPPMLAPSRQKRVWFLAFSS